MMIVKPENDKERVEELRSLNILDTEAEEEFDALTNLVSEMIDVPMAQISLVDEDRQWFKSKVGLTDTQTTRDISFCQHTIMQDAIFEVNNAAESEIFKDSPLVNGELSNIKFYAGAPLKTSNGYNIGALCVIDNKPRKLTDENKVVLREYAKEVVKLIENKRTN